MLLRGGRNHHLGRKLLVPQILLAILLGSLPVSAQQAPASPGMLQERPVPDKPERSTIAIGYSHRRLHLKLNEGSQARLREGVLASNVDDLSALAAVLAGYPGISLERMFSRPEAELAQEKIRIEANSGREQADKNLYYVVVLAADTDAAAVLDDLNALEIVEIAYAEPLPQPPPVTPNFEPQQTYLDPAPNGIDADVAKTRPGGRGENVEIIDIEYGWNQSHEDLSRAVGGFIPNGTYCDPFPSDNLNHGTAVLGELIASENGFGVTGGVPAAGIGMVNAARVSGGFCTYDLANAIDIAQANLTAGDLILIEQQTPGPDSTCTGAGGSQAGLVAVEWVLAYYDSIVSATSDGIIVVEAAGNGSCNYDSGAYGSIFPANRPDSGAIIVGAGGSPGGTVPAGSRIGFSGHGSRVDLQGYGNNVVTTGYGNLQSGAQNQWYTNFFGGTSSASPIVTAAAAVLSSVAQQNGDLLTPMEVRAILKSTGTPQNTSSGTLIGNIGPLPNLNVALGTINDAFANGAVLSGSTGSVAASNVGATGEPSEPASSCVADTRVNSVWWSWTPSVSGTATIDTVGSGFDTTLTVFTGATLPTLVEVGCNNNIDGQPGSPSLVTLNVVAGTAYRIKVDGVNANVGGITLNRSSAAAFTLSVAKAGSGSGTVTSSPVGINCGADCSEAYASGTSVTLTASPAAGSTFSGWSGACTGTGSCVVSMTQARSVTATFATAPTTFTLTVAKAGTGLGTVRSTPAGINCGADCSQAYASGTSVTLTATPKASSTFSGWSGPCTGTGTCVVSMTQARSVTATFNTGGGGPFTLSVVKAGTGSGTVTSSPVGINCGADCSEAYASGTSVTLTARARSGSTFSGWSGACTGTGSCVVSMTQARSVTATFG